MMRKFASLICASLLGSSVAIAQQAPVPQQAVIPQQTAPAGPRLIVAISIDQLSANLFNEYRTSFKGGLKRLSEGVVFSSGFQSHAATETCPGHSTILTGSRPSRTGIIANTWFSRTNGRTSKDGKPDFSIYCAEDPSVEGSTSQDYVASSQFLKVPTLGDRLKAISPQSRVVAVSGKDRGAIMMAGPKADKVLWSGKTGFESYKGVDLSTDLAVKNINKAYELAVSTLEANVLPKHCGSRNMAVALSETVSVGQLAPRRVGDARAFRANPKYDAFTVNMAIEQVKQMGLGKGPAVDVLAVSLSGTDYVGHSFGTNGAEMCAQLASLDTQLGTLFAALDLTKVPYAVVLTADHGGHDIPERNRNNGLPSAQRVDKELLPKAVGSLIAMRLGMTTPALMGDGPFGDIYLSPAVPNNRRKDALRLAADTYRKHPQVAAAFTRDELIAAPRPSGPAEEWTLLERFKASFDPERSGDLLVALKPYVTPIPDTNSGYFATHGSPWNYDRKVPILFWWRGITAFEQPNGVETADIMPTLASLIRLDVPNAEIDGRCLDIIAGPLTNCPL